MISQTRFSKATLKLNYIDDWEYFRDSIVKREINNVISFEKQRDHASHTVYNYLLGYYIYNNSPYVKNLFTDHSKIRKLKDISDFESLWPFASLLHDIGYMFEGSIDKIEVTNQNDLIVLGSNIVNGYFDNIFWSECGNNSTSEIKILEKKASRVVYPGL